uniref:Uncharacterized protein n=1 Tax=Prasinoderma singulare TaxID=676789 RepID=A0A7S3BM94_9VIRI
MACLQKSDRRLCATSAARPRRPAQCWHARGGAAWGGACGAAFAYTSSLARTLSVDIPRQEGVREERGGGGPPRAPQRHADAQGDGAVTVAGIGLQGLLDGIITADDIQG